MKQQLLRRVERIPLLEVVNEFTRNKLKYLTSIT